MKHQGDKNGPGSRRERTSEERKIEPRWFSEENRSPASISISILLFLGDRRELVILRGGWEPRQRKSPGGLTRKRRCRNGILKQELRDSIFENNSGRRNKIVR